MKIIWLYAPRTPEKGKQLIDILASNFDIRHQCSGKKKERTNLDQQERELRREIVVLNCLAPKGARKRKDLQLDLHALACRLAAQFKARSAPGQDTRSGTRGSRSQTHRRAAMGGFTQDDGYVQGVAPMHCARRPRILLDCSAKPQFFLITGSSIPIPVPGQYRLLRCLE